jgi:nucleoside-diphosphate-sugar epimerase
MTIKTESKASLPASAVVAPSKNMNTERLALIAGSTGIVGGNLALLLMEQGWKVYGLARRPSSIGGIVPVIADLLDLGGLVAALDGVAPTHVFFCTWLRQPTEVENVAVNGKMMENLFAALRGKPLQYAALVTGTKHYLGPFESYGQTAAETPFRENTPRLPGLNFYYTQEDVLFREAVAQGFAWTVHRPHTIIGYARGNAMNMGQTLAVYATLCREGGEPFIFPGSHEQWNALTDVSDARIVAQQLSWAASTPAAHQQAYNISNGDLFRWRWLWPQIGEYFGVEWQGPPTGRTLPLEPRMLDAAQRWQAVALKHRLAVRDVNQLVSWWHTDGDLGRTLECVNDMTESRVRGFCAFQPTPASFFDLFDRLRAEGLIPVREPI